MSESSIIGAILTVGDRIQNGDGENLGEIKELLVNSETGKVEYGVLSFGGFMGVGGKPIAVPFESFVYNEEGKYFELNVDMDVLEETSAEIEYHGKYYYIY